MPAWEACATSKRLRTRPLLVLLEGWDCSGKKATAAEAAAQLQGKGLRVRVHVGPLGSSWLNRLTRWVSRTRCPDWARSLVYALDGWGDRVDHTDADVLIQVSSPLRNWAYARVHDQRWRLRLAAVLDRTRVRYDHVWLLVAPLAVRRARHQAQSEAGENVDLAEERFPSEAVAGLLERELRTLLERDGSLSGVLDTELISPSDSASRVVGAVLAALQIEASRHAG